MTRFVSSTNAAAAALPHVCMSVAVDLDFPSGHIRLQDGPGPVTIGGNVYDGTGQVQLLDKVVEDVEVIARSVGLALSGVDPSLITIARAGGYQGRSVTVYLCLFNPNTGVLLDTPETIWEGRMDTITIRLAQGEASMTLNCEHRLRREPRIARYTDQDQKRLYAGDRFFDLLPKIAGFRGTWGAKGVAHDGNTSGGSTPNRPNKGPYWRP